MAKYEPNKDQPMRKVRIWRTTWSDGTGWWVWQCPCAAHGYQPTYAKAVERADAHARQHTSIEGWVDHA